MKPEILVAWPRLPRQMEMLEALCRLHRYDLAADKAAFLPEGGPRCAGMATNGRFPPDSALAEKLPALKSGWPGAAGLDVYLNEPNPDPAFAAMNNVVLYPHHASGAIETREAIAQLVVDNLAAYFAGKPLLTPVN